MTDPPPGIEERRNPFRSSLLIDPPSRRYGLAAVAIAVYVMAFIPLYAAGGVGVTALSMFPVVVFGWLLGAWGGLLAGVGSVPVNAILLGFVGQPGWAMVVGTGAVEGSALVIVVGAVVGLLRDLGLRLDRHLTEWRKAERALRDSEDRYRILFERSRDPIYVSRPDGGVVDANDAMIDLFGYSRSELIDLDVVKLYEDPRARERFAEQIKKAGWVKDFPARLLTKGGEVHECLITASARFDGEEIREYQGTIHDVSHSPGLHELAERRTRELQEAIAELEAFSYSVSHDLRTHLVTMGGFASILWSEHREGLDQEGREYLRRIVESGQRMDGFVRDLLEFSKVSRSELKPETVDLQAVVNEALETLAIPIRQRNATVEVQGELGQVEGDWMLLARAIENMLSNAIKFVPSNRAPQVKLSVERAGGRVRIGVEDNGIGIARADVPRAFRAFERVAPPEFPGTGVGLAIVERAAERMDGLVGVESTPGQGSTFWMSLPSRAD